MCRDSVMLVSWWLVGGNARLGGHGRSVQSAAPIAGFAMLVSESRNQ